jgi:hypothetical protein
MAKLIYFAIASLDGFIEDETGRSIGRRLTKRSTVS